MRELLLVFNVKAHTFLKSAFEFSWANLIKGFSSFIIFGGFAVGIFFLSRGATSYLVQQAHIGLFLFHRFLSMLLYVFFITVNLGNMIVCYATLYRSEEVNFLMGMPISHEKIFLIKFVDNFFYSSSTLWLLGLAMLLGYGSFFSLPWYFYFATMFAILLPFMLVAGILAVLVLMGLIKIASRIGIRRLLSMMIVLYLGAIYAYFKITNPVQLVSEVMKHYPNVNEYFGYLDPPFVQYLPNHWVSEFLYWTINGDLARALPYFFILILTTIGLMIIAWMVAQRLYYPSWLTASDARASQGSKGRLFRLRFLEFGERGIFSGQSDVVLKRDFWMFFREPSQWLHLLLMMLLLVIFLISIGSLELKMTQPLLQVVSYLVIFLFNGFLVASVSLRFVFPAVSLEGDAFWSVRSSPLSITRLYWQKFLFSLLFVLPVAEVLAILSNAMLRDNWLLVGVAAICVGFIAVTLTAINLGAGAIFANYRERNPIRVASSQGASLTFLASMIYLALVVAILVLPLNTYFEDLIIRGISTSHWIYLPIALIGFVSTVLFTLATGFGLRAVRRDF
jgi:ABC-2 type transport system permease protein